MRNILLIIVGIIDVLANVPYIIDSLRGKTRPNMATWSTWSLINLIIVVAALAAGGAINTVVLGLTYFAGSFSILIIGIFRGTRKYTKFDVICQAIALMGVVLWQLQGNPNLALITVIIVGEIAALPTIRHAYRYPEEETWLTFAIAAACALALLLLATSVSFASIAIPLEAVIGNSLFAVIILSRRKKLRTQKA